MKKITYINNNYINHNKAVVSVEDRGFHNNKNFTEIFFKGNHRYLTIFLRTKHIVLKMIFASPKTTGCGSYFYVFS